MIHRMDPPADPSASRCPSGSCRCSRAPGAARRRRAAGRMRSSGTACARSPTRSPASCAWRAATSTTSPASIRSSAGSTGRSARTAAILDGEIVAFDERRPAELRRAAAAHARGLKLAGASGWRRARPVTYMIFDLLWLDGHSLMGLPYPSAASAWALELTGESWQTPEHLIGKGSAVLKASAEQGLEGIVAKRLDSTYEPGRRASSWIKVKNVGRQEFVIGGWMPGRGAAQARASARCSSASTTRTARCATPAASAPASPRRSSTASPACSSPLERARSPFAAGEPRRRGRRLLRAALVAEIEFTEWTKRRQPAPPLLQGPARGQGGRAGRARGRPAGTLEAATRRCDGSVAADERKDGAKATVDGRRPRAEAVQPRQGALPARRASPSAR